MRRLGRPLAHKCDPAKPARFALPRLETPEQIAHAMGLTVAALRFLVFSRSTSEVTHYVRFALVESITILMTVLLKM